MNRKLKKLIKNPFLFIQDMKFFRKEHIKVNKLQSSNIKSNIKFNIKFNINYTYRFNKKTYLYLPHLDSNFDEVINDICDNDYFEILELMILENQNYSSIKELKKYVMLKPHEYRRILINILSDIKNSLNGIIISEDCTPITRVLIRVCKELDIKTYCLLNDINFINENLLYYDKKTKINMLLSDKILCTNFYQKKVLINRGINKNRLLTVSSPLFDKIKNYDKRLTKVEFNKIYGLDISKGTIVYIFDELIYHNTNNIQVEVLFELTKFCNNYNYQLLIREEVQLKSILNSDELKKLKNNPNVIIDRVSRKLTSVLESMYHSELIITTNIGIVYSSLILDKLPMILKTDNNFKCFNSFEIINKFEGNDFTYFLENKNNLLSNWNASDVFTNKLTNNSIDELISFFSNENRKLDELFRIESFSQYINNVGMNSPEVFNSSAKFIPLMLNIQKSGKPNDILDSYKYDLLIQWGNKINKNRFKINRLMLENGMDPYIIEDGFIRSIDIGLSQEPGLSVALCGNTAYYDSKKISNFERDLMSNIVINIDNLERSKNIIDNIVRNKITKYNNSPIHNLDIGNHIEKVLIIDQRFGDVSVAASGASEEDFDQMLIDAIEENPNADIIIKRHPDAIKGGKGSYYSNERVLKFLNYNNLYLIDYDIHPHSLLEIVNKVYVVSSGLGFEALFYGNEVITYGIPFYSGWGVTNDKRRLSRRIKKRTLEEIFYISYIKNSRYFNPLKNEICQIEDVIDYIVKNR